MRKVLEAEAAAILAVDVDEHFEEAVRVILECQGKILTTGIGKAGHIAKKFAATLCSTGTPAVYLHPAEAAHGDLGVVGRNDVMIAFSTSGKSREVLEIIELSSHLGVTRHIGVTSHPDSSLRDCCDIIVNMGDVEEAGCPIGMTPTSSIAVMLAVSDAIAMAVMESRGFSRREYGARHHGGYLGRLARLDNV
ncbi:SIS domain-containing protein [Ensifer adhaerens]|uniref:SIS domain-containing protein n=1 Tax=Ensifer adhaerens TaxID=106592 RepID=UPI000CF09139|nr:SIS domain-containing protein [Ensifer adhaerens]